MYRSALISLILLLTNVCPTFAHPDEDAIISKIEANLVFPDKFKKSNKAAIISFDVFPHGNIFNLTSSRNGVDNEVINQCLLAIQKSAPFNETTWTQHINFICRNQKTK